VLVEWGVRLIASANSFQHTAVSGKGGGSLEAVQQTNLTNTGSYQAVSQRATIESPRRQAGRSVDKIGPGRTDSNCGTPKLGVGELGSSGTWLAAAYKPDQHGELSSILSEGHN